MEHYSAQKKEGNLETRSNGDGWPLRTARQHPEPDPEGCTASESALTRQLQKVGNPRARAKGLWQEELNVLIGCREEPRRSMRSWRKKEVQQIDGVGVLNPKHVFSHILGDQSLGRIGSL